MQFDPEIELQQATPLHPIWQRSSPAAATPLKSWPYSIACRRFSMEVISGRWRGSGSADEPPDGRSAGKRSAGYGKSFNGPEDVLALALQGAGREVICGGTWFIPIGSINRHIGRSHTGSLERCLRCPLGRPRHHGRQRA